MIDNLAYLKGSDSIGPAIALLDAAEREWSMVVFQPEQPILEGELNLLQQAQNRRLRDLLRGTYPKGGVMKDLSPAATGQANEIRLHTQNQAFYAMLDGLMKSVYAYDDPASGSGATEGGNRVTLPTYTSGTYDELVYLEVWFEEVMASSGGTGTDSGGSPAAADTVVYQHGMEGDFTLENDIAVDAVPLPETTRRVQLRGQVKVAQASTLAGTTARGAAGYGYGLVSGTNFYRAGSGSAADGDALDSVDGYAYALPLVRIARQSSIVLDGHITVVASIIPTGSDVADDVIAVQNDFDAHVPQTQGVHGLDASTYLAGTSRSDNLVDYNDLVNVPSLDFTTSGGENGTSTEIARGDHYHDSRYYTEAEVDSLVAGSVPTASEILAELLTVDGAGSGLDADYLDGQSGAYYLAWSNITGKPDPTITLAGDASGSVTLTDLGNGTLTVAVANDSHTHDARYYTESEIDSMLQGFPVDGHTHDDRYYTESESDSRFVNVTGDTMNGALTVNGLLTLGKTGDISSIRFPAAGGGNDPGRIEHDESVSNAAVMRFIVGDDDADSDVFSFGAAPSGTYSEGAKITATGKGYFSSLFVGGTTVSINGHEHDWSDLNGLPSYATRWPSWTEVSSKPSTFPPSSHDHDNRYVRFDVRYIIPATEQENARKNINAVDEDLTLTAGTGLTGGGSLRAPRTFAIKTGGVGTAQLADGAVTAAKLASGAVTAAKLASGSSEADWVGARMASLSLWGIGGIVFAAHTGSSEIFAGNLVPGDDLKLSNANGDSQGTTTLTNFTGFWACLGYVPASSSSSSRTTLWQRVS